MPKRLFKTPTALRESAFLLARGASLRAGAGAFRSPPPPLRPPAYRLVSGQTSAGRGGSVSRRDHNQVYRRHAHLQAEPSPKNRARQTPTALRERGAGGEALLSEKRPLPRMYLTPACSVLPFRRLGLGGTTRPRRERRSGGSIRPKPRRRAEASVPPDVPSAR